MEPGRWLYLSPRAFSVCSGIQMFNARSYYAHERYDSLRTDSSSEPLTSCVSAHVLQTRLISPIVTVNIMGWNSFVPHTAAGLSANSRDPAHFQETCRLIYTDGPRSVWRCLNNKNTYILHNMSHLIPIGTNDFMTTKMISMFRTSIMGITKLHFSVYYLQHKEKKK